MEIGYYRNEEDVLRIHNIKGKDVTYEWIVCGKLYDYDSNYNTSLSNVKDQIKNYKMKIIGLKLLDILYQM